MRTSANRDSSNLIHGGERVCSLKHESGDSSEIHILVAVLVGLLKVRDRVEVPLGPRAALVVEPIVHAGVVVIGAPLADDVGICINEAVSYCTRMESCGLHVQYVGAVEKSSGPSAGYIIHGVLKELTRD